MNTIRVGSASGYWGDYHQATTQLLSGGAVDYLVYDYLAEITMSIMARARAKDAAQGYAVDFVLAALEPNLAEISRQKVKVISNAGGVNARACVAAVRKLIEAAGLDLKVGLVEGDDLLSQRETFAKQGISEMFSGDPLPDPKSIASINAYLGAFPIARALAEGADIVITGRCVDSAVTLGACIHSFGWSEEDWDRLASGTLAGHLIECGPQVTGGNFTDWREVSERLDVVGYPITEISEDGSFVVTKPPGTGGLVTVGTVSEQLLYEIGDPQAYVVPDVICDFSEVSIEHLAEDRVRVQGARGNPAPTDYKVSVTYADGFRGGTLMTFYGIEADHKASAFAELAFRRARRTLEAMDLPDFSETSVETLGAESQYGENRRVEAAREVVVKVAAKHPSDKGITILLREISAMGLSSPPGLTGFQGGRPKPSPVVRLFSFLLPKHQVPLVVEVDGSAFPCEVSNGSAFDAASIQRPTPPLRPEDGTERVPLIRLAWGRSGDKGDKANVGIIARKPEYLPFIWHQLTEEVVARQFGHFLPGRVERFLLPGPLAINFLLHDVLGGGGVASLRSDPQGKGYAQLLLECPISIPRKIADALP